MTSQESRSVPEHLEVYTLNERVLRYLEDLGEWLKHNGSFSPGVNYFEKCTSVDMKKRVGPLWGEIATLFNQIWSKTDIRDL